jgi:hypothetical protein
MTTLPLSPEQLAALCHEIGEEMRELVAAQAAGRLTEEGFVESLLECERERAAAHGLIFTASHTFDDWTVICLRQPGRREPCASFEFHPGTGLFREVGTLCRPADPAPAQRIWDT